MKQFNALVCFILVINCHSVGYSQKITTGIYSGVNLSDIHGQDNYGKWSFKPGPVQGFYLGYSFNRSLGVQTGINFSTIYYEHKSYSSIRDFDPVKYSFGPPYYYPITEMMNFSFLRLPLLFSVSIPSTLQFDMAAGLFFSFLQDYGLNADFYYPEPEKNDFGYIFSSGISYPFDDNFKATFNVSYLTGRKEFFEDMGYRHGSSEFTLGVAYNGFLKSKTPISAKSIRDSSSNKINLTYKGGINISWNSSETDREKYSPYFGPSLGFSLNFPISNKSSFQTGISFERKGYSIKDSSTLFYRYFQDDNMMYYVDTKVEIDYVVLPLLLNFSVGKSDLVFINTGPWLGLKLNARCVGVALNESRSGTNYTLRETVVYDDMEKLLKDNDFGWIFGGGVTLPVNNKYKVVLALQYSTGFKDVFDQSGFVDQQYRSSGGNIIRNGTISFLIGLKIPPSDH